MSYDVVGLGLCTHDFIAIIPHIPQFESSVRMKASSEQGGGPAATATAAASRLGARTAFLARVGDDHSGRFIRADFARYGVDTQYMLTQPGARSHFIICLVEAHTGDRAFVGNDATVTPLQPEDLNLDLIRSAKYLHLDGHAPATSVAAAKAARAAGVTVVMDASHWQSSQVLLPWVDILITSRFFYQEMGGADSPVAAARKLLDFGPREVVITLGSEGCACADAEGAFMLPAFPVQPVVDTTGCGDVFHGAYIVGKLRGYSMRRAAQYAAAAAALKVRCIGGRQGIPTDAEVRSFLHERLPDEWPALA